MFNSPHFTILRHPVLLIAYLVISWAFVARAQSDTSSGGSDMRFSEDKLALIEENLVRDLESTNIGVCIGGTQTVREMKQAVPDYDFSKIIIPLMRIVKDEKGDRAVRILAALALDGLESERGDFAISQESKMSSDEIFKSVCANLAKARMAEKKK